jgi:hypothetical protein
VLGCIYRDSSANHLGCSYTDTHPFNKKFAQREYSMRQWLAGLMTLVFCGLALVQLTSPMAIYWFSLTLTAAAACILRAWGWWFRWLATPCLGVALGSLYWIWPSPLALLEHANLLFTMNLFTHQSPYLEVRQSATLIAIIASMVMIVIPSGAGAVAKLRDETDFVETECAEKQHVEKDNVDIERVEIEAAKIDALTANLGNQADVPSADHAAAALSRVDQAAGSASTLAPVAQPAEQEAESFVSHPQKPTVGIRKSPPSQRREPTF